jgi:hypothetical protein
MAKTLTQPARGMIIVAQIPCDRRINRKDVSGHLSRLPLTSTVLVALATSVVPGPLAAQNPNGTPLEQTTFSNIADVGSPLGDSANSRSCEARISRDALAGLVATVDHGRSRFVGAGGEPEMQRAVPRRPRRSDRFRQPRVGPQRRPLAPVWKQRAIYQGGNLARGELTQHQCAK